MNEALRRSIESEWKKGEEASKLNDENLRWMSLRVV